MQTLFRCGLLLAALLVPAAARSDAGTSITIDNFTFSPDKLAVSKGTEVTWANRDDIPHSIVLAAIKVHSKALDTDNSFSYRFDNAGSYAYVCGLHPQMHGQIVVK